MNMKKLSVKKVQEIASIERRSAKQGEFQKLLFDVARFRHENKRFILPNLYNQETARSCRVVNANNTEVYG